MLDHLWTMNMLKCLKNVLNLHGSIFFTFFDHLEKNQVENFCFSGISNPEIVW